MGHSPPKTLHPHLKFRRKIHDVRLLSANIVEQRDRMKPYWHRVGTAWAHEDDEGFTFRIPPGVSISGEIVFVRTGYGLADLANPRIQARTFVEIAENDRMAPRKKGALILREKRRSGKVTQNNAV
jgi:hypothetical protein